MKTYLYLSLIPESLVASMLPPEEFGNYLAVGTRKRARGQAIFFEVDPSELDSTYFPLGEIAKRCVPHLNGTPKRSLYLSIYRVLEHVPVRALRKLYLATEDGRVLGLEAKPYTPESAPGLHFYQEFCPVTPRVVSRMNPAEFASFITDRSRPVSLPTIVFCDLILRQLRDHPEATDIGDLPYQNIGHLRDCLRELGTGDAPKQTKTVQRSLNSEVLFRTVRSGFFVGSGQDLIFYPMPPVEQLEREYYEWWRSALAAFGQ